MCYEDYLLPTKVKIVGMDWICIAGMATWMLPPDVSPSYSEYFGAHLRIATVAHNWTNFEADDCYRTGRVPKTLEHIMDLYGDPDVPPEWKIMALLFTFFALGEHCNYEDFDNRLIFIGEAIDEFKHQNPSCATGS
jgi:hypothetical protein